MPQRGWEYDLTKCINCHACTVACKMENNTYLPAPGEPGRPVNYRIVVTARSGAYPTPIEQGISMACFHCKDPACKAACPEQAITKDATDGSVSIDASKCVGCGRCAGACPFRAPQLNAKTKKYEKCHFCSHRTAAGLEPACVLSCVGRALKHVPDVSAGGTAPQGLPSVKLTNPSIKFT